MALYCLPSANVSNKKWPWWYESLRMVLALLRLYKSWMSFSVSMKHPMTFFADSDDPVQLFLANHRPRMSWAHVFHTVQKHTARLIWNTDFSYRNLVLRMPKLVHYSVWMNIQGSVGTIRVINHLINPISASCRICLCWYMHALNYYYTLAFNISCSFLLVLSEY